MTAECYIDLPQLQNNSGDLENWIAGLEAGRNELRNLVKGLPVAALAWRPILTSQSIGSLILHIAYTEKYWLTERLDQEEEKYIWHDNGNEIIPAAPNAPLNWYIDQIDSVRAASLLKLSEFPSINQTYTRRSEDGQTQKFALRWILWHLTQHESHHRGQIALLKRWYLESHAPVYA
jgi:uncharacterized damage-inducible protein DinB